MPGPYWIVTAGRQVRLHRQVVEPRFVAGRRRSLPRPDPVRASAARRRLAPAAGRRHQPGRDKRASAICIRVLYHADGVLCPVTFLMHLAAAVPARREGGAAAVRRRRRRARAAASGRCTPATSSSTRSGRSIAAPTGGCWKSRCQPLGDRRPGRRRPLRPPRQRPATDCRSAGA